MVSKGLGKQLEDAVDGGGTSFGAQRIVATDKAFKYVLQDSC